MKEIFEMRVTLRLPKECSLLVKIKTSTRYMLQIAPLMNSIAATLDLDLVRSSANRAFTDLTMHNTPPKYYALVLECVSDSDMLFEVNKEVPYNDGLISTIIHKSNQRAIHDFIPRRQRPMVGTQGTSKRKTNKKKKMCL
jgi:hypothetical protein